MSAPRISSLAAVARRERAVWVSREILPHEPGIRAWLRRARTSPEDIDEIMQEAYCRLASLDSVDHITAPFHYFRSVVRNLLTRRLRRQRIVPMEALLEVDSLADAGPSPEEVAIAHRAERTLAALIDALPERCGRIVRLRKIEGRSQKDIAAQLGTTEKAIEKQVWLGIKLLREAWARAEEDAERRFDRTAAAAGRQRWWK